MRYLLFPLAALVLAMAAPAAHANVAITVDKDAQQMTVAVDGEVRYRWPVSTGKPSAETPNGNHRAFRLEPDHFSKEFDDAPMPHSIFFTKRGHAIHGTMSEKQIGTPVSAGCVRLSRANAATLYKLVEQTGVLKTTVTLTGSSRVALARLKAKPKATAVARGQTTPDYDASGAPLALNRSSATARQIYPQDQVSSQNVGPDESFESRQNLDSRQAYSARGDHRQASHAAPPIPDIADDDYLYSRDAGDTRRYPAPRRARRAQAVQDSQAHYAPRPRYAPRTYDQGYYYAPPAYAPAPGYYGGGRGLFTSGW